MDFGNIIARQGTDCSKWDAMKNIYGSNELLPMWVADADFACPDVIMEALNARLKHPVFGYSFPGESVYKAVIEKMERDHHWKIDKEWILFSNGVVDGLNAALRAISIPGDNIIIQPPVYHVFYSVIRNAGCHVNATPLLYTDRYEMDFDGLDSAFNTRTRAFLLCSPHNPVGRVWTEKELLKAAEICVKHDGIILSDEIHADLVFSPHKHSSTALLGGDILKRSMTFIAASKTYNIPGLATSVVIIPDKSLRKRYISAQGGHNGGNLFGYTATEAAFRHGEEYRRAMLAYVKESMDMFTAYVNERIPQIKVIQAEGTYMLWLDMRGTGIPANKLNAFIVDKCKLALSDGLQFGPQGAGFQRINLACPRVYVKEALRRLSEGFKSI